MNNDSIYAWYRAIYLG